MMVGSGAFTDPAEIPGLAHLCEHMLLLGTKEFPSPTLFQESLASGGGLANAYTTGEQTCVHFEISSFAKNTENQGQFVEHILHILSSFFKNPLFHEKYLKAEIKAVDDEHQGNMSDIDKLLFHSLRLLANKDHPFSRFGSGNHATLSKTSTKKLKAHLTEYFKTNFVASNMVFVLKGPQSINHLRKLVVHFSDIPSSVSSTRNSFRLSRSSFSPHSSNISHSKLCSPFPTRGQSCLFIKTEIACKMRIFFSLGAIKFSPNYGALLRLLCNLLGDESTNSLCEYLKRKENWATLVFVFIQNICTREDLLVVEMDMTPQGLRQFQQVVITFFFYVEEILSSSQKFRDYIEEWEHVEEYSFLLRKKDNSLNEVCEYAERLQRNTGDVVKGYERWNFDAGDVVQEVLGAIQNCIARDKFSLIITDSKFSAAKKFENVGVALRDPHYDFEYLEMEIHGPQFESFNPKAFFRFPEPMIDLYKWAPMPTAHSQGRLIPKIRDFEIARLHPQLLKYSRNSEIWVQMPSLKDIGFQAVCISVVLQFPNLPLNPETLVGIELIVEMVGEELKYPLYHHEVVGSSWGMFANINGLPSIMVTVCGTKHSLKHILKQIFSSIREQFQNLRDYNYQHSKKARTTTRKKYEDYSVAKSIKKVFSASYLILEEKMILPEVRMEALEMIDAEYLQGLCAQMSKGISLSILFSGDFDALECVDISTEVYLSETSQEVKLSNRTEYSSHILKRGVSYWFETQGTEDDNVNTVFYYIQIGQRTECLQYTFAKLLEHILSLTALSELRTKRQLAYSVFTGIRLFRRTFGIHITIPSGQYDCQYLTDQIEEYLLEVELRLAEHTDVSFQNEIVLPFLQTLHQDGEPSNPSSLFASLLPLQKSGRDLDCEGFRDHWNYLLQIISSTYEFGSRDCEETIDEEYLKILTQKEFLASFQNIVSIKSHQRSNLIIANCAGTKKKAVQVKQVATAVYSQLHENGFEVSVEQMTSMLQSCSDQEEFSDLSKQLQTFFKANGQGSKFTRFSLLSLAGSLYTGIFRKIAYAPKMRIQMGSQSKDNPLTIPRTNVVDYRQIQKEGKVALLTSPHAKFGKLMQIERSQDCTLEARF